jgi:hypothetical protein
MSSHHSCLSDVVVLMCVRVLIAYEVMWLLLYSVCMNIHSATSNSNHYSTNHLITVWQGRLFSYSDTHRHRLGANYLQIPVNCPYRTRVTNYQRDGPQTFTSNQEGAPNYYPNSFSGPEDVPDSANTKFALTGDVARQVQWPRHTLLDAALTAFSIWFISVLMSHLLSLPSGHFPRK